MGVEVTGLQLSLRKLTVGVRKYRRSFCGVQYRSDTVWMVRLIFFFFLPTPSQVMGIEFLSRRKEFVDLYTGSLRLRRPSPFFWLRVLYFTTHFVWIVRNRFPLRWKTSTYYLCSPSLFLCMCYPLLSLTRYHFTLKTSLRFTLENFFFVLVGIWTSLFDSLHPSTHVWTNPFRYETFITRS